jgi:uncharacterized protein YkwD
MKLRVFSAVRIFTLALIAGLFFNSFAPEIQASQNASLNRDTRVESEVNPVLEKDERRILDLINRERAKKGLSSLEWNSDLARLARNYSQQMAQENFFSHYDRDGFSVFERIKSTKINDWNKLGENLFECTGTREFISLSVEKWMQSPGHRRNILDSEFNTSGIGVAMTRDGKIYVTQVFLRR